MPRSNETVALNSKDSRHDLPFSSLNSRSKSEVTILKGKKRQVKYSLEYSKHLGGGSTAFKQYTAVHTKIYNTRRANGPYKSPPSLPWPWLRPFRRRSKNSTRKRERLTTPLPLSRSWAYWAYFLLHLRRAAAARPPNEATFERIWGREREKVERERGREGAKRAECDMWKSF